MKSLEMHLAQMMLGWLCEKHLVLMTVDSLVRMNARFVPGGCFSNFYIKKGRISKVSLFFYPLLGYEPKEYWCLPTK